MKRRKGSMWAIGLSESEANHIAEHAGRGVTLKRWPSDVIPTVRELEEDNPFLLWVHWRIWQQLTAKRRGSYRHLETIQRAALVDESHTREDLIQLLDSGFAAILQMPPAPKTVKDTVAKAAEARHLSDDIYRMAKEILLERELFQRKSAQLEILNRFLTRVTETLDPSEIMRRAQEDLSLLLPICLLQGIFWFPGQDQPLDAEIFLAAGNDYQTHEEWIELLLTHAATLAGKPVNGYRITHITNTDMDGTETLRPQPAQVAILPLRAGGVLFGCLAILSEQEYHLGKDQVQVLQSAMNHLGLALNNALLYRKVKTEAEFDGLTRIYNRQHFDTKMKEEVRRHLRYGQAMSLILMDLDHFKSINDSNGHQAGDQVLKEVARLIQETVRTSDIAARYGGEEFALLLPNTPPGHAWMLAERLRRRIAQNSLGVCRQAVRVTASFGVAALDVHAAIPDQDLIARADSALYSAKALGRNQVHLDPRLQQETLERHSL